MPNDIVEDLRQLLLSGSASTQDEICQALAARGHEVNQSKVSRTLRKLGAVKGKNERGEIVYRIPFEPAPPTLNDNIASLILALNHNENLLVVTTSPGAAQLVARIVDYHNKSLGVLATIAGDDTVLVIPSSIKQIDACLHALQHLLFQQ